MKLVFVAGPLQDDLENVYKAMDVANQLADNGYLVYLPHLTHYWNVRLHRDRDYWLRLDLAILPICDCLLRLSGDSDGADGEVRKARSLNIPVYFSIQDLVEAEKCIG